MLKTVVLCTMLLPSAHYRSAGADTFFSITGRNLVPLDSFKECAYCPEMVVLPMGTFIMGAPLNESALLRAQSTGKPLPEDQSGYAHEGPQHQVSIDIPVAIGRNEVTRFEWQSCVSDGACSQMPDATILGRFEKKQADDPEHPVIRTTVKDALDYIDWLNRKVGKEVYRLPTEAEWEYAARAGTQTKFAQGDSLSRDQANFTTFYLVRNQWTTDRSIFTMPLPVKELDAANDWGLRHMSGNVSEITMTCFSDRHLGLTTASAYLHKATQAQTCRRTYKGGDFSSTREHARVGARRSMGEMVGYSSIGFRVLREMR